LVRSRWSLVSIAAVCLALLVCCSWAFEGPSALGRSAPPVRGDVRGRLLSARPLKVSPGVEALEGLFSDVWAIKPGKVLRASGALADAVAEISRSLLASGARGVSARGLKHLGLLLVKGDLGSSALDGLLASGLIEWAERLPRRCFLSSIPSDEFFPKQWHLSNSGSRALAEELSGAGGHPMSLSAGCDVSALGAWGISSGDESILIGLVDTGVDLDHPDLRDRIWRNPREEGNGLDDDGNGYVDDLHGFDFGDGDPDPRDDSRGPGHGTHCAGISVASWNGRGIVGVAPRCRVVPLKVADSSGSLLPEAYLKALDYALGLARRGDGLRVLNLSLGGPVRSRAEEEALRSLSGAGAVVVAASGNNSLDGDLFPSTFPAGYRIRGLLSVGASDGEDGVAFFSNVGRSFVHLFAPGLNLISAIPEAAASPRSYRGADGGLYEVESGTSMAAPVVSGIASLVLSASSDLSPAQVGALILAGARRVGSLMGSSLLGGRADALGALKGITSSDPMIGGLSGVLFEPGQEVRVYGKGLLPVGSVSVGGEEVPYVGSDDEVSFLLPKGLDADEAYVRCELRRGDGRAISFDLMVARLGSSERLPLSRIYPYGGMTAVSGEVAYGLVYHEEKGFGLARLGLRDFGVELLGFFEDQEAARFAQLFSVDGILYMLDPDGVWRFDEGKGFLLVARHPSDSGLLLWPFIAPHRDGYLFVAGGARGVAADGERLELEGGVYRLDLKSGTWRKLGSMRFPRLLGASCAVDGKLFLVGGLDERGEPTPFVEVFSLREGYVSDFKLPSRLCGGSLAFDGSKVYYLGASALDEVFSDRTTSWILWTDRRSPSDFELAPLAFLEEEVLGLNFWTVVDGTAARLMGVRFSDLPLLGQGKPALTIAALPLSCSSLGEGYYGPEEVVVEVGGGCGVGGSALLHVGWTLIASMLGGSLWPRR